MTMVMIRRVLFSMVAAGKIIDKFLPAQTIPWTNRRKVSLYQSFRKVLKKNSKKKEKN